MGTFKLNDSFKKKIKKKCQKKASNLAKEAREKLTNQYIVLLDLYYADYQPKMNAYDVPYYERTFNLYKSAHRYYENSHNSSFYGGVRIDASEMKDYPGSRNQEISAQRLLDKFIYTQTQPSATWHGGDWHGGYGNMNGFSIYNEIHKYRDELLKDFKKRCSVN